MGLRAQVQQVMRDSQREIIEAVWPLLGGSVGGTLVPNELTAGPTSSLLDMSAGIDYFNIRTNGSLIAMATRVQWPTDGKAYRTHTIRYKRPDGRMTEYGKLDVALRTGGGLVPHLIIHAYMGLPRGSGHVIRAGVARTSDLVAVMREMLFRYGDKWTGLRRNPDDGVVFGAVPWSELEQRGLPLADLRPCGSMFGEWPHEFNGGLARMLERAS